MDEVNKSKRSMNDVLNVKDIKIKPTIYMIIVIIKVIKTITLMIVVTKKCYKNNIAIMKVTLIEMKVI